MKVYQGNYDGRRFAMVAAKNQREAAEAIGTTLHDFRKYYHEAADDDDRAIALNSPGTVFFAAMHQGKWSARE